jgi:hypothetical protein
VIEDLLSDLAADGWTISWAFQFAPDHWRVSIIKHIDTKIYFTHCADAPSFKDALEDAMCKRNDAEWQLEQPTTCANTPSTKIDLISALGIRPAASPKIDRRI